MARHPAIVALLRFSVLANAMLFAWEAHAQSAPHILPDEVGAFARDGTTVVATRNMTIGSSLPSPGSIGPEVLNGKETLYKYVVGISYTDARGEATCTGTIVGKRLVLTAGHCGCGSRYSVTQHVDMSRREFFIAVRGRPILLDPLACLRPAMISPGYDLALLRLEADAQIGSEYDPVFMPAFSLRKLSRIGSNMRVMGYGRTESGTKGRRMEAFVPVYTPDCAKLMFMSAGCVASLEMMLSSMNRGNPDRPTDTCSGDSGGPVFVETQGGAGKDPQLVLFAVTSRPAPLPHIDTANHCGGGSINIVLGRTDVLYWLYLNGASGLKMYFDP